MTTARKDKFPEEMNQAYRVSRSLQVNHEVWKLVRGHPILPRTKAQRREGILSPVNNLSGSRFQEALKE